MPRTAMPREELEAPYRHPYRYWLPHAWRTTSGNAVAAYGGLVSGALVAAGVAADSGALAGMGGVSAAGTLGLLGWWMGKSALIVRRRARHWDQPGELASVRSKRPHAGARDPEVAHDEYAVTVEEQGELWVWRFRPLPIDAGEDPGEVLVPGRPEYTAVVVQTLAFDARDAARAAEQLAAAQERAAELERRAAEDAARRLARYGEADEVAAEARSTAAALRHLTGQSRRR